MKKQCKKVMFLLRLVFFICRVLRLNAVKNMDYVSEGKVTFFRKAHKFAKLRRFKWSAPIK